MWSCKGCTARWTGMSMAHCPSCHGTFSTVSNFDVHRSGGKCVAPSSLGLRQNSRGTWLREGERDISELRPAS